MVKVGDTEYRRNHRNIQRTIDLAIAKPEIPKPMRPYQHLSRTVKPNLST